jgi:hypothetical protein
MANLGGKPMGLFKRRDNGSGCDSRILKGSGLSGIFLLILFAACAISFSNARAALTSTLYSNESGSYGSMDTSGGLVAINALQGSLTWR